MNRVAWPFRLVGAVLGGALLITAVFVGIAPRLWAIANAHEETPVALPAFQPLSQRTYVYDAVGSVIAVFEREKTEPIKLDQVPEPVIRALLAVEDNEFYIHHGVNLRGSMRALLSNVSGDAPRQGASTITQQVVKNEYLAGLPRDGRYKWLQINYARWLEHDLSKADILERYLNTVFFGNNAYGLQAAAEVYFGKNVQDLTMIEGAFLAGLVRSPSGYDPIRKLERSRSRFEQVAERLADVGLLTKPEADWYANYWVLPETVATVPTLDTKPTYYTEALREFLLQKSNLLGDTEQERANLLYRGGLRIHTTLDPSLQAFAEQARNTLPANAAGFDAAIVTLDTTSGAVRAMVGGKGFDARDDAINMALVPRQTGSSIKLFILAAALQAGAVPQDIIDGIRGCSLPIPDDTKAPPFVITGGEAGSITTLATQTRLSINCAFARLSQIVGLNRVVDTTYRMAHSMYLYQGQPEDERDPVHPYASFATGANTMAPLDMASGMQTIVNQGLHKDPYYVDSIDRADRSRLYTHEDPGTQVLDPGVALTAVDMMKGVLRSGTAQRALRNFPFPAAGKTGTQDDNTNAWFVGGTPALTTAVWVGDPDAYTPMVCGKFINGKRTCTIPEWNKIDGYTSIVGGSYPARIWGAMMQPALAQQPPVDWPAAPAPARKAMRLYLPGVECLASLVSGDLPIPGAPTTTTAPTTTVPVTTPDGSVVPPPATVPPKVVLRQIESGTTIAPDNLDPKAPLPMVDLKTVVYNCQSPPPGVVLLPKKK